MMAALVTTLLIDTILSFLTVSVLIELLLFCVRGRHPRLASFCRLLPFIKLPLDLLRLDFSHWAIVSGDNPLTAPQGSRFLSAWVSPSGETGLGFHLSNGTTFSPGDLVSLLLPKYLLVGIAITWMTLTLTLWTIRLLRFRRRSRCLRARLATVRLCVRKVGALQAELDRMKVTLLATPDSIAPFALGARRSLIVLPDRLVDTLSQLEFEAVIQHELAHIRWYDGASRWLVHLIANLFWWVPMGWMVRRLEQAQEESCDQCATNSLALATAINKAVHFSQSEQLALRSGDLTRRVRRLLGPQKSALFVASCVAIGVLELGAGSFWLF